MTKKINWRLKEQPTSESLRELVSSGLLTKEEAREILFAEVEETARDVKSLETEIKFLRELVERLAKNRSTIVETIEYIEKPYSQYYWYVPYQSWCGITTTTASLGNSTCYINGTNTTSTGTAGFTGGSNFSSINTF